MDKKLKSFQDLIFEGFGQHERYDEILYQLTRCREILIKECDFVIKLSVWDLYILVVTVNTIVLNSQSHVVRETSIITEKQEIGEDELLFSLMKGYKKRSSISIDLTPQKRKF